MKVSELWLRDFVESPLSISELSEHLTNGGIEVDALEYVGSEKRNAILTFKIPPNRGDCLSAEGIAREISLLTDALMKPLKIPPIANGIQESFPIQVDAPKHCPRYLGCVIQKVDNALPVPTWLREKLETAGIRSVSTVVDIMNYVMLELGQPLHAFDLNTLEKEIVVRMAKKNEKILLLNDQEVELTEETLIIADAKRAQAIAGLMGGKASSVTDKTETLFVESAYFDSVSIRLAGQQYSIKTDSSYRFERGVDPLLQRRALERAVELIVQITGGKSGVIIEKKDEKFLPKTPSVYLREKKIKQLLGVSLDKKIIEALLKQLNMTVEVVKDGYRVLPPSYRQDIAIEVDLIEEIARIYGLHRLPSEKLMGLLKVPLLSEKKIHERSFKEILVNRGYSEAITYSFVDPKLLALFGENSETLSLHNPIASDLAVMRNSLWPGLLQAMQYNQHRQFSRVRLFEMGVCFFKEGDKVVEKLCLAGMCSGTFLQEQWGEKARAHDFYDVKGDLEALLGLMGDKTLLFRKAEHSALHPGQTAQIVRGEQVVGFLGALHPKITKTFKLEEPIFAFELEVQLLSNREVPVFHTLSKFPTIRRDIAIVLDKTVSVGQIRATLEGSVGKLLQAVRVFDIYQGKGIDLEKKSVALGLILGDPSRTLKEDEASDIVEKAVVRLCEQFGAILRE